MLFFFWLGLGLGCICQNRDFFDRITRTDERVRVLPVITPIILSTNAAGLKFGGMIACGVLT